MGIVVRRLLAPATGSWFLVPGSCRSTWRQNFKQILDELSLCLFGVQYGIQRAQKEILGV